MSDVRGVRDVEISAVDLAPRVDEALAVEAAAFGRPVASFRRDSYLGHATYPGYAAVAALHAQRLVGFAYGHVNEPGQWWHDQIAAAVRMAGHERWLRHAFVLVELHVRPEFQRRGIGRALLITLLGARNEARALLSAHDTDTPARRLYRNLGFLELLTGFRFAGTTQPFIVMGASLPLAQAS